MLLLSDTIGRISGIYLIIDSGNSAKCQNWLLKKYKMRYFIMYNIVIVGAGGFGREIYLYAKESFPDNQYKIKKIQWKYTYPLN